MIKEKELREMRPQIRYKDGLEVTLQSVQEALLEAAGQVGLPVAFYTDQVKYGGMIGGSTEDCIVLYHPEHQKDYFKVCIRVKKQGSYAFVSVNDFGTSRLLGNEGSHEYMVSSVKNFWKDKDNDGTEMIGAVVGAGVRRLVKGGRNSQKLEEERNWYTMVSDLFDDVIS